MSREAMQMALHTLEGWANYGKWVWPESALEQAKRNTTESIAALRQALETEQEPVYWSVAIDELRKALEAQMRLRRRDDLSTEFIIEQVLKEKNT
jgi:hypothetical protein